MFCDSAEPKSIEELRQMDCLAKPAIKGAGSITAGISLLKEFDVIVSQESKNLIQEQRTYFWQQLKTQQFNLFHSFTNYRVSGRSMLFIN